MATTRSYLDYLNDKVDISPANSQEELDASQLIESIMQEHGLDTSLQEFAAPAAPELPRAILLVIMVIGMVLSGILGSVVGLVGLALVLVPSILLGLRFGGRDLISGIGTRARSQNVIGVHRASGPLVVKGNRPIVIVAHYDSPNEGLLFQPQLARWQPLLMRSSLWCGISVAFCSLIQVIAIIPASIRHVFWVLGMLAALPLLLVGIAGIYGRFASCTTGANDNKASVAAMLGVLDKLRPADDEAKAWAAAHPHSEGVGEGPSAPLEEELEVESDEEASERAFASLDELPADRGGEDVTSTAPSPADSTAAEGLHPATAAFTPQVIPAPEPEGPKSVRRGARLIEELQILPESCQIVYQKPPVPQVVLPDLPEIDVDGALPGVSPSASGSTSEMGETSSGAGARPEPGATMPEFMARANARISESSLEEESSADPAKAAEGGSTQGSSTDDALIADFEVIDPDAPSRPAELLASVKSALSHVRELIPRGERQAPKIERGEELASGQPGEQPVVQVADGQGTEADEKGESLQPEDPSQTVATPAVTYEDEEALLAEVHARAAGDTVPSVSLDAAGPKDAPGITDGPSSDPQGAADEEERVLVAVDAEGEEADSESELADARDEEPLPYDGPMASQFETPSVHDVEPRKVDPASVPSINDAYLDNAAIFMRLKAVPNPAIAPVPEPNFAHEQDSQLEPQVGGQSLRREDASADLQPGFAADGADGSEAVQEGTALEGAPRSQDEQAEELVPEEGAQPDSEAVPVPVTDGGPATEEAWVDGPRAESATAEVTEGDVEGEDEPPCDSQQFDGEDLREGSAGAGEPDQQAEVSEAGASRGEADALDDGAAFEDEAEPLVQDVAEPGQATLPDGTRPAGAGAETLEQEPAKDEAPLPRFSLFAPLRDDYIMDAEFERLPEDGPTPGADELGQTMAQPVVADGSDEPTLVTMPVAEDDVEERPIEREEPEASTEVAPDSDEEMPVEGGEPSAAEPLDEAEPEDDRPERAVGYVLGEEPAEVDQSELTLDARPFVSAEDVRVTESSATGDPAQELDPNATVIAPNLSFMEDEEPSEEELASKDVSGLDTYAMDGTEPRPAEPRRPEPTAVDDPNWGKSEFTPQPGNIARRVVLFDLPDPSEATPDPLAPEEPSPTPAPRGIDEGRARPSAADLSYTRGEREPLGVVGEGALRSESPRPRGGSHQARPMGKKRFNIFGRHKDQTEDSDSLSSWLGVDEDFDAKKSGCEIGSWDNFSDAKQGRPRDGWKGGATSRFDLRLVEDEPAGSEEGASQASAEGYTLGGEEPQAMEPREGIGMEELREAITSMGDDELLAHDVWFVALGASGLDHAGAKRFMAEHRKDIRGAFVVNLDSIGAGRLSVLTSEGATSPRRADRRMVRLLSKIADDLHVGLEKVRFDWADTDATLAMQSSMRAATIMGVSEDGVPALSHTADDVPENLDAAQVVDVAELVAELIRRA